MTTPRIYLATDILAVTAFPLSDDVGYVVRLGDGDYDGAYLGSVFHEEGRGVAYAPPDPVLASVPIGSSTDLDDLMTDSFLRQLKIPDASDG